MPAARHFVADLLTGRGLDGAAFAAASLVSELATNCVIHARTPFTVEVVERHDAVRVCVTDTSPVQARVRRHSLDSTTGRGLRLVASLATAWGAEGDRNGKTIWFEVSAQTPDAAAAPGQDRLSFDADVETLLASFDDDGFSGRALLDRTAA